MWEIVVISCLVRKCYECIFVSMLSWYLLNLIVAICIHYDRHQWKFLFYIINSASYNKLYGARKMHPLKDRGHSCWRIRFFLVICWSYWDVPCRASWQAYAARHTVASYFNRMLVMFTETSYRHRIRSAAHSNSICVRVWLRTASILTENFQMRCAKLNKVSFMWHLCGWGFSTKLNQIWHYVK